MAIYEITSVGLTRIDKPANDVVNNLPIGTVLQLNGYDYPKYVIVGQLSDVTYRHINLNTYAYGVTNTVGLKHISTKVDDSIALYYTDNKYSADQIINAISSVKAAELKRISDKEQAEQKASDHVKELEAKYSHLVKANKEKYDYRKVGAKNIRKELRLAFPGVKFSVRSESYSGGDSIHIRWSDEGLSRQAVEEITNKYQQDDFNPMEDIYDYDNSVFTNLFGGAKYVFAQRERF